MISFKKTNLEALLRWQDATVDQVLQWSKKFLKKTRFLTDNFFDQNKSYHLLDLIFEVPNMPLYLKLDL